MLYKYLNINISYGFRYELYVIEFVDLNCRSTDDGQILDLVRKIEYK